MSVMAFVPSFRQIYEPSPASLATESGRLPAELSKQTSSLESEKYTQIQQLSVPILESAAKDSFVRFCTEVLQFDSDDDEDDQIATFARDAALAVAVRAYTRLPQKWRKPRIATDGGGGVRLTWKTDQKELRAVFPADTARPCYLFVQTQTEQYLISNFTATTLSDEFNSL